MTFRRLNLYLSIKAIKMKKIILAFGILGLLSVTACKVTDETIPTPSGGPGNLGYTGDDDMSKVPTSTNFSFGTNSANLPASVDLTPKFPPIGDQGQYGTCVAWAVGYNYKTAIEGMSKNYTASQLASSANQMSPKDLFTAIDDSKKGQDCNGTNFSYALDLAQARGIATLQTAPYSSLGSCASSGVQQSWTADAANHKIKSYRKIEASVDLIKEYLSKNIPIIFGAKLSDNFMTWNSDAVLSSNSSYDQVGIHAYHALVVSGYDNSKGANGAFKIINSWGGQWGSQGYIWIDYNFFVSTFCNDGSGEKPLFIAVNNDDGSVNPPPPDPSAGGVDLAPWIFSDAGLGGNARRMYLNVYNIGTQAASPSTNWNMYYIYYNAYNANDYGVIAYDEFNTSIPANTFQNIDANHAVFNYAIPAGGNLTQTVFGTQYINRDYYMPNITGQYFLVLIADAGNAFSEKNEENNLFYTTDYPKYFQYGASSKGVASDNNFSFENKLQPLAQYLKKNEYNSGVRKGNLNAYRPDEIIALIKEKKRNGDLDAKIEAYKKSNNPKGGYHQ